MSYASVTKTDGTSVVVDNTVLDTGATEHDVDDDVLDTLAVQHTIFAASLTLDGANIVQFTLDEDRMFTL